MAVDCGDAAPSEGAPKDLKPRGHNYIRHRLFVDGFENEIFLVLLLFRSKPFKRTQNISNLLVLKLLIESVLIGILKFDSSSYMYIRSHLETVLTHRDGAHLLSTFKFQEYGLAPRNNTSNRYHKNLQNIPQSKPGHQY